MSWAIVTPTGKWNVDDFTLGEIDELASKHKASWGDIEFSPGANVELLYDLVCAGCDKTGSPHPTKPSTHGDRMRLLDMLERVEVKLPTEVDEADDGTVVPLDGNQERART